SVSTKVLEWCALGLPAVVSRTQGMTHFFGPDALTFVEPGSAEDLRQRLLELHKDPSAAAAKAGRAQTMVHQRFDWKRERATLIELVDRLGGRKR
ncbi:MAG: glycosyltransferase, partial [Actinomycetota bacterium]